MERKIDLLDYNMLEVSRDNWFAGCLILIVLVVSVLISTISYCIGSSNAKYDLKSAIVKSGYSLTYIESMTNSYYVIEKNVLN